MSASSALSDSFAFSWQRIVEVSGKEASDDVAVAGGPLGTQRAGPTGKRDSAGPGHGGPEGTHYSVFVPGNEP